ncbi:MAG: hypothetical protein JW860_11615, partial [Sedimentisphaerales bacterium]|nr:hypothetical protein [Sedimentisphaerales bacterium]
VQVTIWADPRTALPIRIEQKQPGLEIVCKNFEFDVELDESLFSMEVPEGYTMQQSQLDLTGSSEEQFIEYLRIFADIVCDGRFPPNVDIATVQRMALQIGQKLDALDLTEPEKMELGMQFAQGLLFLRFFKGEGSWHYAGDGVELGDSQTPIFWYRPEGSDHYRIIYGDLTVDEVLPEDIPQTQNPEDKASRSYNLPAYKGFDFVGSQIDTWLITNSGYIEILSRIKLIKWPQDGHFMEINLPYSEGQIVSITSENEYITWQDMGDGIFTLELNDNFYQQSEKIIKVNWTLPLEILGTPEKGYNTSLKGLIPLGFYKLIVELEPDSDFDFVDGFEGPPFIPFFASFKTPQREFGSCGLGIRAK